MTLFEAFYGIKPPQLALGPYQQINVAAVEELLQERWRINQNLRENLAQARTRIKLYIDKYKSEREFQLEDWLCLELQPYPQCSVIKRVNKKMFPSILAHIK